MSARSGVEVLRYWLGLLRHEEALAVRPRARRIAAAELPSVPELAAPAPGQDYMKLPVTSHERFFVQKRGTFEQPLNGEACAFFEDWLHQRYRRGAEEEKLEHLVFFPSLLLPRGELAGLLRFGVSLGWQGADGSAFSVPTPAERARKQFPAPPVSFTLRASGGNADDGAPYFVDAKLLRETLRIDLERQDAFFANLRDRVVSARQMIGELCRLLLAQLAADGAGVDEAEVSRLPAALAAREDDERTNDVGGATDDAPGEEDSPNVDAALLAQLYQVVRRRLAQLESQTRVFDVAVLLDASRNRASYHVQRDLQAALTLVEANEVAKLDPLSVYLGEEKVRGEREWLLGRSRGATLTDSQRKAGELFLGSRFCAVQGPPGTGKTHLIASLAADALVKQIAHVPKSKHPSTHILLVTSTNNRAVDNVVEPLGRDTAQGRLPLALRVGSRDVIEKVTANELRRAKRWLDNAKPASDAEFEQAKQTYIDSRAKVEAFLSPWLEQRQSREQLERVEDDVARLEAVRESDTTETELDTALRELGIAKGPPSHETLQQVASALAPLAQRLSELSLMADPDGNTAPIRLERHFQNTQKQCLPALSQLFETPLALPLPPRPAENATAEERREAWEQAAEDALALVLRLQNAVDQRVEVQSRSELQARLLARRDELREREAKLPRTTELDWGPLEPQLWGLTDAALALRECWARVHKTPLVAALDAAIQACERAKSLRALLQSSKGPGTWLRRLYPVWGCTLLSLGNNFSPEPGQIERVVIDEAGQCHAAYAVSAMLRAQSVLVIGDTNQLEPVVDLTRQDEARVKRGLKLRISDTQLEPFRSYEGAGNSAQSVADRVVHERPTLIDHFRCQAEIAQICETLCGYGLRTHTPKRSCAHLAPELGHPLLHTPVEGEQERFSGSWRNVAELAQTVRWLQRLLAVGLAPSDLGVITPFRGQLEALWRELRAARIPLERSHAEEEQATLFGNTDVGVALGTVHRFQGGERRIILFTTTVTEPRSLRFVDERVNLVNVAASRAKEHLITIGHTKTLKAGLHTRALLEGARRSTL
jgi:hypothetical protein